MITKNLSRTVLFGVASAMMTLSFAGPVSAEALNVSASTAIDASERSSPEALLALLGDFIDARDMDGVLAIHEPDAALVEWGGGVARGEDAIKRVYADFFATEPDLKVNALQVIDSGGVAIILGSYTLDYLNANGKTVSVKGNFGDMVRQQPDGSWLYLLDNPYAP